MEGTYGIGVANRYELFYVEGEDVDVDDQETLQKPKKVAAVAPAAPVAAAPKKPVTAAAKAPAPASKAPAAAAAGGQKVLNAKENIRGDGQQRGPKATPANGTGGAPRQGGNATGGAGAGPRQGNNKENRSNNAGGEQRALNGEKRQSGPRRDGDRPPRNSGEGGANVERKNRRNENFRGGDREGGAGGANGGEGGAPRRRFNNDGAPRNGGAGGDRAGGNRKREFDRQSGSDKTGVKAVGKRDGGGAHNWGSDKQEINYALNDVQETNGEYENQDAHNVSGEEGKDTSAGEAGEASPPAPKELTLDEYKALKAANRAKLQTYSLLGDEKAPASAAPAATAAAAPAQVSAEDAEHLSQRAGRQKQIFDVNFHFGEGNRRRQRRNEGEEGGRPGGERGERREGGGGGGRREGGGGGERRDGGNRGERREPRQAGGEAEGGQDGQRERRPRFNRDDNNRNNRNNNNNDRTSFNNRGGRNAAAAPQQPPRVDEFNFPSLG